MGHHSPSFVPTISLFFVVLNPNFGAIRTKLAVGTYIKATVKIGEHPEDARISETCRVES
jgi:hypothetical protein